MITRVILLLTVLIAHHAAVAQPAYNNCNNSLQLCPGEVYNANNIGANVTVCPNCEDDFNFCFTSQNSIWFSFMTNNSGGDVQVDFTNLLFQAGAGQDNELQASVVEMVVPCDASTYTQLGNCVSNETANFSLNAVGLNPNSMYYIVVDGDNTGVGISSPAECSFDISVSGLGVDRPVSSVNLAQSSASICLNDVVTFTAEPVDCPDAGDYYWFINGILTAVTNDSIFETSALQDGDVVSVNTSCYLDCPDTVSNSSVPFTVFSFAIDAGEDFNIVVGESVILNGSTTAPVYIWSPSFYLSDTGILDPAAVPDETITYTLEATQNGCTLFDYVTVFVDNGLSIPNTFSPNGDGSNDTWVIKGIENFPDCHLQIFDRWGQKIYQDTGYSDNTAWDGTINRDVAEGVYFYVLDLRSANEEVLNGSVTVIR